MKYLVSIIFLFAQSFIYSQVIVSGFIEDNQSKEQLPGVHIYNSSNKQGIISNSFGFYSLHIPINDTIQLTFSYLGYQKQILDICLHENKELNIQLKKGLYLSEVVVLAQKDIVNTPQMSVLNIPVQELKQLPSLMGEVDVLRAFQLMPGIQSGKEGTSNIYVRGGSSDQNLILIDDIPLYYVNHIGGFISVFNTEAIKNIDLYKGGFPARYGGRLSSIMDIRMKEGNMSEFTGSYTLGIITSKLTIEGPIKTNKSSFIISARRSLFDLFTRAFQYLNSQGKFSAGYTLYDLNAKINQIINKKNRLYFSLYSGRDRLFVNQKDYTTSAEYPYKLKSESDLNWGNHNFSFRWNHLYNSNLFSNLTVGYTKFFYNSESDIFKADKETGNKIGTISNHFNSKINDIIGKIDFDYYLEKHQIKFGSGVIAHQFNPTMNKFVQNGTQEQNIDTSFGSPQINTIELYSYFEDEFQLTKSFSVNLGLHLNALLESNFPIFSIEPRFISNYKFNRNLSIKSSFSQMSQAVHLLSNNDAGLPTDLWVPATKDVPNEKSSLFAVGFAGKINKKHSIDWSLEAFYKTMSNLIEFNEGASFFSGTTDWSKKVEKDGTGKVLGLELLLHKKNGNTTGWISYALSKNMRRFENLNSGKPFPYKFDRRHEISIVLNHKFNEKIHLSTSWVFSSGTAISLPSTKYELYVLDWQDNQRIGYIYDEVHLYGERNNYRTPTYHRLDINLNFTKTVPKGIRVFSLGAYNAYSRLNPYYLYFDYDSEGQRKLYSFSLFPIIPSISYSLQF